MPCALSLVEPLQWMRKTRSTPSSFIMTARSWLEMSTSLVSRVMYTSQPSASRASRSCRETSRLTSYSGTPVKRPEVPEATLAFVSELPGATAS